MVLDLTAIVSIIRREQGHARLLSAIEAAPQVAVGAPTLAQAGAVLVARLGLRGRALLSLFLERVGVEVIPFDEEHWQETAAAFIRYGPSRHPAGLDLGECMTYATARLAGTPLLAVGSGLALTDLPIAA